MQRWVSIRQVTPPRKAAILPSSDPSRPGASNRPRCVYALRDQVDIWALSDLCTPWCVHVVATLRIADHIAAVDRRPNSSSRNGMRHFWILERIPVGILAAYAPPEHLNRRRVDRDDEELSQVAGRRFQRPNAVPGMGRPLEK